MSKSLQQGELFDPNGRVTHQEIRDVFTPITVHPKYFFNIKAKREEILMSKLQEIPFYDDYPQVLQNKRWFTDFNIEDPVKEALKNSCHVSRMSKLRQASKIPFQPKYTQKRRYDDMANERGEHMDEDSMPQAENAFIQEAEEAKPAAESSAQETTEVELPKEEYVVVPYEDSVEREQKRQRRHEKNISDHLSGDWNHPFVKQKPDPYQWGTLWFATLNKKWEKVSKQEKKEIERLNRLGRWHQAAKDKKKKLRKLKRLLEVKQIAKLPESSTLLDVRQSILRRFDKYLVKKQKYIQPLNEIVLNIEAIEAGALTKSEVCTYFKKIMKLMHDKKTIHYGELAFYVNKISKLLERLNTNMTGKGTVYDAEIFHIWISLLLKCYVEFGNAKSIYHVADVVRLSKSYCDASGSSESYFFDNLSFIHKLIRTVIQYYGNVEALKDDIYSTVIMRRLPNRDIFEKVVPENTQQPSEEETDENQKLEEEDVNASSSDDDSDDEPEETQTNAEVEAVSAPVSKPEPKPEDLVDYSLSALVKVLLSLISSKSRYNAETYNLCMVANVMTRNYAAAEQIFTNILLPRKLLNIESINTMMLSLLARKENKIGSQQEALTTKVLETYKLVQKHGLSPNEQTVQMLSQATNDRALVESLVHTAVPSLSGLLSDSFFVISKNPSKKKLWSEMMEEEDEGLEETKDNDTTLSLERMKTYEALISFYSRLNTAADKSQQSDYPTVLSKLYESVRDLWNINEKQHLCLSLRNEVKERVQVMSNICNLMIENYMKLGEYADAEAIFEDMKVHCLKPNTRTFKLLLICAKRSKCSDYTWIGDLTKLQLLSNARVHAAWLNSDIDLVQ